MGAPNSFLSSINSNSNNNALITFHCNCVRWIGLPTNTSLVGPPADIDGFLIVPSCVSHSISSVSGVDQKLSKPRQFRISDPRAQGRGLGGPLKHRRSKARPVTTGCSQAAVELLSIHVRNSANASSLYFPLPSRQHLCKHQWRLSCMTCVCI